MFSHELWFCCVVFIRNVTYCFCLKYWWNVYMHKFNQIFLYLIAFSVGCVLLYIRTTHWVKWLVGTHLTTFSSPALPLVPTHCTTFSYPVSELCSEQHSVGAASTIYCKAFLTFQRVFLKKCGDKVSLSHLRLSRERERVWVGGLVSAVYTSS